MEVTTAQAYKVSYGIKFYKNNIYTCPTINNYIPSQTLTPCVVGTVCFALQVQTILASFTPF